MPEVMEEKPTALNELPDFEHIDKASDFGSLAVAETNTIREWLSERVENPGSEEKVTLEEVGRLLLFSRELAEYSRWLRESSEQISRDTVRLYEEANAFISDYPAYRAKLVRWYQEKADFYGAATG